MEHLTCPTAASQVIRRILPCISLLGSGAREKRRSMREEKQRMKNTKSLGGFSELFIPDWIRRPRDLRHVAVEESYR
jgi:hypothetical protein